MNTRDQNEPDQDNDVHALLRNAGARPNPPREAVDRAYSALKSEWRENVGLRRRRRVQRFAAGGALAASVLLALVVLRTPETPPVEDGPSTLAAGSLVLDGSRVQPGDDLPALTGLFMVVEETARLVTAQGADLRADAGARARWLAADRLLLERGRIYVDTRDQANFTVNTPLGEVRDIGTRFLVEFKDQTLAMAVREGAAELDAGDAVYRAEADAESAALVLADAGGVSQAREPAAHPRWDWIHEVGAGYAERSVPVLIHLIGRDLGKRIEYASIGVEAAIANEVVSGSLVGMGPHQALDLIARSAELRWREDADRIILDFIH